MNDRLPREGSIPSENQSVVAACTDISEFSQSISPLKHLVDLSLLPCR